MADDDLILRVRLDGARKASGEAKELRGAITGVGNTAQKTGKQQVAAAKGAERHGRALRLVGRGAAYALGAGGFGGGLFALFEVGHDVVAQYRESQITMRATKQVLKTTGGAANVSAKHVGNLATKLSMMAGVDDEIIQKSENMLLTFRDVRNEQGKGNKIFDRGTKASLDMAAAFKAAGKEMSPTAAALQIGKALNDPIKGMTRLTRVGVTFTDQQVEQVEKMTEAGNVAGAQRVILRELEKEFGGQAKATALPGDKLKVAIGNLEEQIGKGLAPTITKAVNKMTPFVQGMVDGTGAGGRFVDKLEQVWKNAKPIVFWFGRAAKNVGEFAVEHPGLVKIATALILTRKALRLTRWASSITGISRMVGWGRRLATMKIGQRTVANIVGSEGLGGLWRAGQPKLASFRTKFVGRMRWIGKLGGKALVAGIIAGLVLEGPAISKWINENVRDPIQQALDDAVPGGAPDPTGGNPLIPITPGSNPFKRGGPFKGTHPANPRPPSQTPKGTKPGGRNRALPSPVVAPAPGVGGLSAIGPGSTHPLRATLVTPSGKVLMEFTGKAERDRDNRR